MPLLRWRVTTHALRTKLRRVNDRLRWMITPSVIWRTLVRYRRTVVGRLECPTVAGEPSKSLIAFQNGDSPKWSSSETKQRGDEALSDDDRWAGESGCK
jgi:hypothetical protein